VETHRQAYGKESFAPEFPLLHIGGNVRGRKSIFPATEVIFLSSKALIIQSFSRSFAVALHGILNVHALPLVLLHSYKL
jgi:hypothetical protein